AARVLLRTSRGLHDAVQRQELAHDHPAHDSASSRTGSGRSDSPEPWESSISGWPLQRNLRARERSPAGVERIRGAERAGRPPCTGPPPSTPSRASPPARASPCTRRTSPTSCAAHGSSRSDRDVPPSRGGGKPAKRCPSSVLPLPARKSCRDLLEQPPVAVRIAERSVGLVRATLRVRAGDAPSGEVGHLA